MGQDQSYYRGREQRAKLLKRRSQRGLAAGHRAKGARLTPGMWLGEPMVLVTKTGTQELLVCRTDYYIWKAISKGSPWYGSGA